MTTTMSYKEWLDSQKATALTARDEAVTAANKAYDTSMYAAALQRQASQPTYGATAEALGSAGLTGSGYSNYLKQSADEAFRMNADTARQTQKTTVADATKLYEKNVTDAQNMYDAAVGELMTKYYNQIQGEDAEGNPVDALDTKDVYKAYKKGNIPQNYYDNLVKGFNDSWLYTIGANVQSTPYFDENNTLRKRSDIGFTAEEIAENPMLSEKNKADTSKLIEYYYTPYYDKEGTTGFSVDADTLDGIEVDDDGFYTIEKLKGADGTKLKDIRLKKVDKSTAEGESVGEVSSEVPAGKFFYYNNEIYLAAGNGAYYRLDSKNHKGGNYISILQSIRPYLKTDYFKVTGYTDVQLGT